jgi:hypothetical protein
MTRLEKNKAKRSYKRSIIFCFVILSLIPVMIGIISILPKIESDAVIFILMCIVIMPFFLSLIPLFKGNDYLSEIKEYKRDLIQKRNDILVKMAIETMKGDLSDKNIYNKVITIHNAMTFIDCKAFIKGYIIATYKNSSNPKLKEFVEKRLIKLFENKMIINNLK